MSVLICGSIAYDTIMVFSGQFKNEILPDKVHILNVAFLVPELRREFGGTAGNIAYSLSLLGEKALPMATVGKDFGAYADWLDRNGITRRLIREMPDIYTAQAYITTDLDDNQITAFHPGAMNFSHAQQIVAEYGANPVRFGTISPDGREGMLQHAEQFSEADIPFLFDPGQGLPMFSASEIKDFIDKASYVSVNDYESELLTKRSGLSLSQIANRVTALIVTRGNKGSHIYADGEVIEIPCAHATALTDPTGCGDAYRGGLLYGLLNDMDWAVTGRVASLMGAIKIERPGPQSHHVTLDEFRERYRKEFGHSMT